MKIVFFSNNIQNTKHFREPLVKFLKKKKHELYLITFDKKIQNYETKFLSYFDNVYGINVKKITTFSLLKSIFKIYKIFKHLEPNIILSFTLQANIISSILSKLTNYKFVLNVTGLGSYFISGNKYLGHTLKRILKLSKYFVFQNKSDYKFFFKANEDQKKKYVIPSLGIKIQKKKNIYTKKKTVSFIMVSRIIKDKGIIEYMSASNFFLKNKNICFFLAGGIDKSNPSRIKKDKFFSLLKSSNVKYLGHINNIQKIIPKYSCIVLPSYREGFSKTLLEAGSYGIPAITSNVPGCYDIIQNNINGLLCKPRSVTSLIKSINLFLKMNHETKKRLSDNAYQKVFRKFNQDIILEKYYKKIIDVIKN